MDYRQTDRSRPDPAGLLAVALLIVALLVGGGGSPAPLLELALQCAAALVAAAWLLTAPAPWRRVPRQAWVLAALIVAVPALHLVPLPAALWQLLPGRDGQIAALDLVGADATWRGMTVSASRTLASLLAALTAMLSLVLAASLGPRERWWLIGVAALGGLATIVVGAAQLSGGAANPLRFFDPHQIYLTGFQANHNSTADVLLIALLALAALGRAGIDRGLVRPGRLSLAAAIVLIDGLMVLGLFLTGSRAGLALLPLVLLFQYLILQPDRKIRWVRLAGSTVIGGLLAGMAIAVLRGNRAVETVLARFTLEGEFRPELWRDSLFALDQYWPAGSGQGTFVPVMLAAERLEVVDPTLPNRAHNDYLELAIETGLPGMIVLAVVSTLILTALVRARRTPPAGSRTQVLFAAGALAVVALHSLIDYPLRSMALAALAATAVGLLFPARPAQPKQSGGSRL